VAETESTQAHRKDTIQQQKTQPNESMQHFLAGVEVVFARRIREGGEAAQSRTTRAGFQRLGTVHGDVVLPGGEGAFLARDLRRSGVLVLQRCPSLGMALYNASIRSNPTITARSTLADVRSPLATLLTYEASTLIFVAMRT
jgi:hypothetical protein